MRGYELAPDAERDLLEIARYSLRTWGREQTDRYESALTSLLERIGSGGTPTRRVFEHRADVRVARCKHHFVFVQLRGGRVPLIVAVLHESMDLMSRLRRRLDPSDEPGV